MRYAGGEYAINFSERYLVSDTYLIRLIHAEFLIRLIKFFKKSNYFKLQFPDKISPDYFYQHEVRCLWVYFYCLYWLQIFHQYKLYVYITVYIRFFWKYCLLTSLAQTVVFDLTVCCHWSFSASDGKGARELYTLRVGENTAYDSPVLFPTAPPTPLSWLPSTFCTAPKATRPALLKSSLFKQTCSWPWTLNMFGEI